jgi:hypothetical protein
VEVVAAVVSVFMVVATLCALAVMVVTGRVLLVKIPTLSSAISI